MKRSTKFISLLLVLVLLCGGYFYLQNVEKGAKVTEESGTYALTDHTVDALSGFSWTIDGTLCHFVQTDSVWSNAEDADFPTDQDAVQKLADKLMALEADRRLEGVENPADYGLAEPSFTVTAEWSDGTQSQYAMGDETPFGDGYYITLSDDATVVYTVDSALSDLFSKTLTDLAVLEELPTVEQPSRLTIGNVLDVTYCENSTTLDADQNWYDTATGYALEDESVQTLLSAVQSVSWNELLTTAATEEELSSWNLTEDTAVSIALYDENEIAFTLMIGATDESENYYARLADSQMVYTVTSDSVDSLINVDPTAMELGKLIPLSFDNLAEATFTLGDASYTYQRSEVPSENESESSEIIVTQNGEETDAVAAETLWSLAYEMTVTAASDDVAEGDALITISAANQNGVRTTFEFFACDADSYLVLTSEGRTLLTPADAVDKLIRNVRQLG